MKNDKMEKAIIGVAGDSNLLNALIPHLPENVKKQIANRRTIKRSGKMLDIWTQIDFQIRQQKFPILFLCKPAPAVIISQEEYKRLKKLDKEQKEMDLLFDGIRESMAKEIGMTKEQLFPNIYGNEEEKRKYMEYENRIVARYGKGLGEVADKYEKELEEIISRANPADFGNQVHKLLSRGGKITGFAITPNGIEVEGVIPNEKRPKE